MVFTCPTLPAAIIGASGADLEKDLADVSGSSASLSATGGDNTNIYKLLLTAANISPSPAVSSTERQAVSADGIFISGPPTRTGGPRNIYWVENGTMVAKYVNSCTQCTGLTPCTNPQVVDNLQTAGYSVGSNFNCKITELTPTITATQIIEKFNIPSTGDPVVSDPAVETLLDRYGFTPLANMTGKTSTEIQTALTNLNNRVQFTYCAYQKMYHTALTAFFTNPTVENRTRAILLNIKLMIITSGLNRIRIYFQSKSSSIMASSNTENNIAGKNAELSSQLATLTSKDGERQLYARMVEYTEEKNQAHRNLLGMYTVLNLVALGLIFYIARE
jgi:hypothetical protein